ncbi:MAG: hypothetical protein ACLR3C_12570 [Eggerthella lenta]
MHLGLRADKEGRTAALRVIGGFACNEGFVFSLFYLGENRAFGDGPFAFERADLWGTLACMLIAFALLRMASPRARDALLSRPLVWCYAGLLVLGSLMPAIAGGATTASCWRACSSACRRVSCWPHGVRALGRRPVGDSVPQVFLSAAVAAGRLPARGRDRRAPGGVRPQAASAGKRFRAARAAADARRRKRGDVPGRLLVLRRPLGDEGAGTRRRGFRRRSSPVPCCSAWPQASWRRSAPIPAWLPRPRCWPACCCSCCSASHRCSFWA